MTLVPQDRMAIVASFPGCHKNLKSLGTFHWRRFPKHTPREGVFVALTKRQGAAIVRDGNVEGPAAHKPEPILAFWKVKP